MNREQLVEMVAETIYADDASLVFDPDAAADLAGAASDTAAIYRSNAAAVIDVLLPLVTTVDEVTALPHRTVLVSAEGEIFHWSWRMPMNLRLVAEAMLESGPLTIVWQPA